MNSDDLYHVQFVGILLPSTPSCFRTLTFDLQRRLPSDRVRGTITLTVENHSLPTNPSTTISPGERQLVALRAEPSDAPTNAPRLSSPAHRISRLTSLCSEDSIDNDLQDVGGAMPGDNSSEAIPSSNDDVIAVDRNEDGVHSSETVQIGEAAAAESAETGRDGADVDTTVTTLSDPKQLVTVEQTPHKSVQRDESHEGPTTAAAANGKTISLEKLDMIRTTLYGGSRRVPSAGKRRAHTVLSRHVSLRVPPRDGSHDSNLKKVSKLSGSISMFQIGNSDFTESLPPSEFISITCTTTVIATL